MTTRIFVSLIPDVLGYQESQLHTPAATVVHSFHNMTDRTSKPEPNKPFLH